MGSDLAINWLKSTALRKEQWKAIMSDIEKELDNITAGMTDAPEQALPSLEEQKAIVAKLKQLEAEGKLTPEVLEEHFGKFSDDENNAPLH